MTVMGKAFRGVWGVMNQSNLDAAVVAVMWQEMAAVALQAEMDWGKRLLLFLAVWVVYCFDRLNDVGMKTGSHVPSTRRHQFHSKYRFSLRLTGQFLGFIAFGLAFANLNSEAWIGAGFVIGWTLVHILLNQSRLISRSFPISKEWRVGFIFAAGILIQPWSLRDLENPHIFWVWICLGGVFASNCLWFSFWDGDIASERKKKISTLNWSAVVATLALTSIGLQLGMGWEPATVGFLLAFSGLLLLLIENRFSSASTLWKQHMADFILLAVPGIYLIIRTMIIE